MFRKSRKPSSHPNANNSTTNDRRFVQIDNVATSETTDGIAFSVGNSTPKQQLGFFSKLFKRSTETIAPKTTTEAGMKRKSIWQRSKSILRSRNTNFEQEKQQNGHSNSTMITDMPIRGSGSAARLCYEDVAYEHYQKNGPIFDPDAFLSQIFAENDLMYTELKQRKNPGTGNEDDSAEPATASVITTGIDDPLSGVVNELLSCSQIAHHEHLHFCDDPKLDSPLLSDCSASLADSVTDTQVHDSESQGNSKVSNDSVHESESSSEYSLVASLRSFISGDYDLEGVEENSLDEMASFFGQMDISDGQPQKLPDGTLRYVFNNEDSDSVESIRFHDWTIDTKLKLRSCQSETLKLTEIGVNTEKVPGRSASVAEIPTNYGERREATQMTRRRTVSAKISEIVAFFEGGAIISRGNQ